MLLLFYVLERRVISEIRISWCYLNSKNNNNERERETITITSFFHATCHLLNCSHFLASCCLWKLKFESFFLSSGFPQKLAKNVKGRILLWSVVENLCSKDILSTKQKNPKMHSHCKTALNEWKKMGERNKIKEENWGNCCVLLRNCILIARL
jgi:hypothetical protein